MEVDSKSAPNFHILSSGVAKSIINLCVGQISSLKLIPRNRITGSKGLKECKALGFYCQMVPGPLLLGGEETAPGVISIEVGAAHPAALPVTSTLKVGGIIIISQKRNPRAENCVPYPKSQPGK